MFRRIHPLSLHLSVVVLLAVAASGQSSSLADLEAKLAALPKSDAAGRKAAMTEIVGLPAEVSSPWIEKRLDDDKADGAELTLLVSVLDGSAAEPRRLMAAALKTPVNPRIHRQMALRIAAAKNDAAKLALIDVHRFAENASKIDCIVALSQSFPIADYHVQVLVPHLTAQADPALRHEALRALATHLDRRFFKYVTVAAAKDTSVYRRADWITWSAKFDSNEALLAMLPYLGEPADAVVERAFLGAARAMKSADVTKWFRSTGAVSPNRLIRLATTAHLAEHGRDALNVLVTLANDPDPGIAGAALRALGARTEQASLDTLEKKISHRDPFLAADALASYWQASGPSAKAVELVKSIAAESKSWELRVCALDLLRKDHAEATRDLAILNAEHERSQVRLAAYSNLTYSRTKPTVEFLLERLDKEEGRNLLELIAALHDLTNFDFGRSKEKWMNWWTGIRASFELPPKPTRKATTASEYASYYGITVRSERVCFLIDTSGSMAAAVKKTTRLAQMKENLSAVVKSLNDRTKFNVIAFSTGLVPWSAQLVRAVPADGERAVTWIKALESAGATNIYDALDRALEMPEVDTIFLLSDGAPSAGRIVDTKAILEDISRRNRFLRIRINTILVGNDATSRNFMRTLAESNFGEFVESR